jgi:hypothetical protein
MILIDKTSDLGRLYFERVVHVSWQTREIGFESLTERERFDVLMQLNQTGSTA